MLASTAAIISAEPIKTKESVVIKTEPEYESFQATYDIEVERIKPETLLYADHEIKDEMFIGPTVVNRPASGTRPINTENICKTLPIYSRVIVKDAVNDLWCARCDLWFLTPADLINHELSHTELMNVHINTRNFQCDICKKQFKTKFILKRHLTVHLGLVFQCNVCDKQFTFKGNLSRHHKLHSENNQILSCDICDTKFTTKRYLVGHIKQHNENRLPENWCDICKKGYIKRINLDWHLCAFHKSGKAIEELINRCKVCNKDLSKPSLWKHKLIHRGERLNNEALTEIIQNNEKVFVCNKCQKIFFKNSCFNAHKAHHNTSSASSTVIGQKVLIAGETKHQCDICQKTFSRGCYLKIHFNLHTGTFTCDFCKNIFLSKLDLADHIHNHKTSENLFSCEICKKLFKTNSYLQRHLEVHLDRNFQCDICKKKYTSKHRLDRHMYVHIETHLFQCTICNTQFKTKIDLRRHVKIHLGGNFQCNVCEKHFKFNSSLRSLMYVHTDARAQCHICKKTIQNK